MIMKHTAAGIARVIIIKEINESTMQTVKAQEGKTHASLYTANVNTAQKLCHAMIILYGRT